MKKTIVILMVMGVAMLLSGGLLVFASGQGKNTPAVGAIRNGNAIVNRVPSGAKFPVCWSTTFSELPDLAVGKEVEITITVGAPIFDMKEVEFIPMTGKALILVSGEKWKGELKKGTSHAMKLIVKPTKTGINGIYGVLVKAPQFYAEVSAYVQEQKDGQYADEAAKKSVLDQVAGMRKAEPDYEEWFGSTIEIKPVGGK